MYRRQFITGMGMTIGALAACAQEGEQHANSAPMTPTPIRGEALDAQTLEDALIGSSYLGCGGGGSLQAARALIAADLAKGLKFQKIPVNQLADTDRVACPYSLASLAPVSADMQARLDAIENKITAPTLAAFGLLERHLDTKFAAVILGEIGPLSMAEGLSIAAQLGIPALDADTVGRATPEINQHSVRVAGHPLTPAAGVTPFGDEIILQNIQDANREEDLFRGLSVVSREIGVTDAPITGAIAKSENTLIKDSLTLAINIGRAVRQAREAGRNPIEAGKKAGKGYTLFEGRVETSKWADRDGFLVGDIILVGTGDNRGDRMVLDYRNEHLVARLNGQVVATCPDLITMIDNKTHEGVNNPDFENEQGVTVLAFQCDPLWRRPQGLAVFEPRYFGYDLDYIPLETLLAL